jgi:hypothetical protein
MSHFNTDPYEPLRQGAKANGRAPAKINVKFKNAATFCAEYVPLAYTIEGLVRTSSLYTLTAKTGHGKTAFNVVTALAVATGRTDILGREVARGRVAYLACENPDDIRMRLKIAAHVFAIDLDELGDRILILDERLKPEDVCGELARLARVEPFALVIVDTFAAFFDGNDVNDNVQAGQFTRRLRPFTQVMGLPTVLVAAHPVKNASADALVPYGGGAILNEVDGNLTLWKESTGILTLHSQGKLRGLDFQPIPFWMDIMGSRDIVDVKGREVLLPIMRASTEQIAQERQQSEVNTERALLREVFANPSGSQQVWAEAIWRAKSSVNGKLQKLKTEGLVNAVLGKWTVTPKGIKALEASDGQTA